MYKKSRILLELNKNINNNIKLDVDHYTIWNRIKLKEVLLLEHMGFLKFLELICVNCWLDVLGAFSFNDFCIQPRKKQNNRVLSRTNKNQFTVLLSSAHHCCHTWQSYLMFFLIFQYTTQTSKSTAPSLWMHRLTSTRPSSPNSCPPRPRATTRSTSEISPRSSKVRNNHILACLNQSVLIERVATPEVSADWSIA